MARGWARPLLLAIVVGLTTWYATLLATPFVLMQIAERRVSQVSGVNHMFDAPLVTARSRAIVRPSPDLLYSTCVFDVSNGVVVLDIEPIDAPYWSVSVFDHATNVAFVKNNLQTHNKALHLAIFRASQNLPAGYAPVKVSGDHGIALLRILVDRAKPIDMINLQRRRSTCRQTGL